MELSCGAALSDDWPEKRIMRRLFILREVAATFFKVFSSLLEMKSLVYHLFQNRKVQSMQLDTYMIKAVRGCLILTTHRFYLLAASCRLGTSMIVYRLVWPFLQKHLCNICASSELWILMNWTCPMCRYTNVYSIPTPTSLPRICTHILPSRHWFEEGEWQDASGDLHGRHSNLLHAPSPYKVQAWFALLPLQGELLVEHWSFLFSAIFIQILVHDFQTELGWTDWW